MTLESHYVQQLGNTSSNGRNGFPYLGKTPTWGQGARFFWTSLKGPRGGMDIDVQMKLSLKTKKRPLKKWKLYDIHASCWIF